MVAFGTQAQFRRYPYRHAILLVFGFHVKGFTCAISVYRLDRYWKRLGVLSMIILVALVVMHSFSYIICIEEIN